MCWVYPWFYDGYNVSLCVPFLVYLWDWVIRLAFAILCVGSCSCSYGVFRSPKVKREKFE